MLEEFDSRIGTEEDAVRFIREAREEMGIKCLRCGSERYYFDAYNRRWVCKDCRKQLALVSETLLHATQLPVLYWLKVVYCFAVDPTTTRVKLIQDEVEPDADIHRVWEMLMKIRSLVSAYVEGNKKLFSGKKYNVDAANRDPKFAQYYTDEMKYKVYIREKDDWGKFTELLGVCLTARPPFKHQTYRTKKETAE